MFMALAHIDNVWAICHNFCVCLGWGGGGGLFSCVLLIYIYLHLTTSVPG